MSLSFLFIPALSLTNPLNFSSEFKKFVKNDRRERHIFIREYNWEKRAATNDFKRDFNTSGVAVGASALCVLLIRVGADSGLLQREIGGMPLGVWIFFAMALM